MQKLFNIILSTYASKIFAMLVAMFTLSITARALGPELRGQFATITTCSIFIATITNLSLGQVTINIAVKNKNNSWFSESFFGLLFFGVFATLASGALVALAIRLNFFNNIELSYLFIGLLAVPFNIWGAYSVSLMQVLNKLALYNRFQIYASSTSLTLTPLFILLFDWGLKGALLAHIVSQAILASGGTLYLLKKAGQFVMPKFNFLRNFIVQGLKMHLNSIGMILISGTDIMMLSYFIGSDEAGYFQLSVQLIGVLTLLPTAASMVIFGIIGRLGPDKAWPQQQLIILVIITIMVFAIIAAAIGSPYIIVLIAGEEFQKSTSIFQILLFGIPAMSLSVMMGPQWIGRGYFFGASLLTLFVGIMNVSLNWIFIPLYASFGAAYATLLSFSISMFVNIIFAFHVYKKTLAYTEN